MRWKSKKPRGPQPNRARRLNLIYFVDSAKTRSLKLPIGLVKFAIVGLAGICVWNAASFVLIGWLWQNLQTLEAHHQEALEKVLEYQIRYDGVYERAYSTESTSTNLTSNDALTDSDLLTNSDALAGNDARKATEEPRNASPATSERALAGTDSEPASSSPTPTENANSARPGQPSTASQVAQPPPAAASRGPAVAIESPSYQVTGQVLTVTFKIRNTASPERQEGYVYAVARFVEPNGSKTFVPVPRSINIDASGQPQTPERGNRYAIRNFRSSQLIFRQPPTAAGGRFDAVEIYLRDKAGNQLSQTLEIEPPRLGRTDRRQDGGA